MGTSRLPPPAPPAPAAAAALAKKALRQLAQAQLEPTPENYARAYAEEAGQPLPLAADNKAQGAAWAALIERLARNLERGGRQWTAARRKESLQRVLSGSRSDAGRLLQRLQSLLTAWEADRQSEPAQAATGEAPAAAPAEMPAEVAAKVAAEAAAEVAAEAVPANRPDFAPTSPSTRPAATGAAARAGRAGDPLWPPLVAVLEGTVRAGLPADQARAAELADQLGRLGDAVAAAGATPEHVAAIAAVCERVKRLFAHRHHLVDELGALCRELTHGLTDLAEDDSWARGQCEDVQARLADGVSVRSVRAASELLAETRHRQQRVRVERQAARDALKDFIHRMLNEVGELGQHTGHFQRALSQHAQAIAHADSLESLAGVVKAMLDDSHAVHSAVSLSQQRLQDDRARAGELEARVRELEAELRRLSDEVSTDALTQVANRRGLAQAFAAETADGRPEGARLAPLAVGLIDIDNFKKLNDTLGHAAGDVALQSLAGAVREQLRPTDHLARFGGEEFVVLMPATALAEAQQVLTRLQRLLTASLFMHDGQDVFVTFSAGVTTWQPGEALPSTLERADEALYEAKRTGKNRTCMA